MHDLIDTAQITERLAAARDARDHLDKVIGWLEDGVALFTPTLPPELPAATVPPSRPGGGLADEPAQLPATPPSPIAQRRPARPVRAGARDLDGKVLGVILNSNVPLTKAEVITTVGESAYKVEQALKRLAADRAIQPVGATSARRYKPAAHQQPSATRIKQDAAAARNAAKVQDGIARVVFRDQVARAIAADPGLTAAQLTVGMAADHDDVVEACGWLVEHHQATVADDGTYSRHSTGRARPRSAA